VWSMFESAVSDHGSFSISQLGSLLSARATSRPRSRQQTRTTARSQARRRSDRVSTRPIITLPRRYACQKSMRREMRSARPFTVNNSGIDARNGQAYHGRQTIATKGAPTTTLGTRATEEPHRQCRRGRRCPSRVRSGARAPGRTRVLRARTEASIARSSMK